MTVEEFHNYILDFILCSNKMYRIEKEHYFFVCPGFNIPIEFYTKIALTDEDKEYDDKIFMVGGHKFYVKRIKFEDPKRMIIINK